MDSTGLLKGREASAAFSSPSPSLAEAKKKRREGKEEEEVEEENEASLSLLLLTPLLLLLSLLPPRLAFRALYAVYNGSLGVHGPISSILMVISESERDPVV